MNFLDPRLPMRFWDKCTPEPNSGCWLWFASSDRHGYGKVSVAGVMKLAYRCSFEVLKHQVPAGLHLDHLCRNPACVNPAHLEPVTPLENVRRGLNGDLRTHCKHGHEFTEGNTAIDSWSGYERRKCRTCRSRRDTIKTAKRRKALAAEGLCINARSHGAATEGRYCTACSPRKKAA